MNHAADAVLRNLAESRMNSSTFYGTLLRVIVTQRSIAKDYSL